MRSDAIAEKGELGRGWQSQLLAPAQGVDENKNYANLQSCQEESIDR